MDHDSAPSYTSPAVVLALMMVVSLPALAVDVVVLDEDSYGGPIGGFYAGSFGGPPNTSAAYIGEVTPESLSGARLFWAVPANAFTTGEIDAMSAFLAGGGRIGFVGEWYGFATARDEAINAAVAALGGHVSIGSTFTDSGYPRYALRSNGRIADDPFTEGVDSFVYGSFSPLALAEPAKALVRGEDGASVLLAYEPIGPGFVFVMSDQNPWDLDPFSAGTDTRVLFTNILTAPEPGMTAVAAIVALAIARRVRGAAEHARLRADGERDARAENDGRLRA